MQFTRGSTPGLLILVMAPSVSLAVAYATIAGLASILSACAAPTTDALRHTFNWDRTKYVYAFGDSYTFVQGTEGLATFRFARLSRVPCNTPID